MPSPIAVLLPAVVGGVPPATDSPGPSARRAPLSPNANWLPSLPALPLPLWLPLRRRNPNSPAEPVAAALLPRTDQPNLIRSSPRARSLICSALNASGSGSVVLLPDSGWLSSSSACS